MLWINGAEIFRNLFEFGGYCMFSKIFWCLHGYVEKYTNSYCESAMTINELRVAFVVLFNYVLSKRNSEYI